MIYEQMLAECKRLEEQIESLKIELKKFPDGKIICTRNGKRYKWYLSNGSSCTYLPKSKRSLAEKLAAKKYLSLSLEDCIHEKKAIDYYLRHHNPEGSLAEKMLLRMPEYTELMSPYFTPLSKELQEWGASPFNANPKYPEQLIFRTTSGRYVRSKSEVIIDMYLSIHQIPFRYESPLCLNNLTLYPDFTIRHPQTGQFYYWEHFGLADDPDYCQNMNSKLNLYTSNGIIPTINLITTSETKEHPLDVNLVNKIIQHYFL
ncbi:MAG: ATPase [Dorea sp.]|nr:ATPase [Dorea sp.]